MGHIFIKDITPGMQINDVYMISQPVLRPTARGDLYIAMFLSDRTGKINTRMWQATKQIYEQLPSEGFVRVRGNSELYQNALQLVINDVQVVDSDKVSLADYLPRTQKDVNQMFQEVRQMLGAIRDPGLKALVQDFLADAELMKAFCTAPAAMQLHHSFLGGLLEHVHNMLRVATVVLPLYPKVQADLVLAAIFLHDMAKTRELAYDMSFGYTDEGQLIGHIVQGAVMVQKRADALAQKGVAIDKAVLDSLLHIVVSHHGQYEFGSPKLPATPEAFMINYIDNLDAKMNQVGDTIDNDPGDAAWTPFVKSLDTRLYKKRPLARQ